MGLFTGLIADRKAARLFRIEIDANTLIPENRTAFRVGDGPDFIEFSELPEVVNLNKSAYWTNEQVVGRGEPWKNYASTSPTRINFTAKLVATGGSESAEGFTRGVKGLAGFGLGLTGRFAAPTQPFLGIAGNVISAAANSAVPGSNLLQFLGGDSDDKVRLTFEEVHRKLAWLEALLHPQVDNLGRSFPPPAVFLSYGGNFRRRGVVPDISVVFRGPWEINTLMCMVAEVSIVFEEANAVPKSYSEVRSKERPTGEVAGANFSDRAKQTALDFARSTFGI